MARQWYYDGVAIPGATGKTHTLTAGQDDPQLIECRTDRSFGADSVAALVGASEQASEASLTINTATYTPPQDGQQASISLQYTYDGADTLVAYAATGTDPVTVSDAQLIAGSGGTNTIEFASSVLGAPPGTVGFSGSFTSASEAADRVVIHVKEQSGAAGDTIEVVVSGLDYTDQSLSSASPVDDSTDVSLTATHDLTFSDAPHGSLVLRLVSDDSAVETFDVDAETSDGSSTISVAGNVVSVTTAGLSNSTAYWWDYGGVTDEAGNPIDTAPDNTTLNFTTAAAASGVAIANAAALAIDEGNNYQTSHSGAAAGFACDGGANNMVVAYCVISDGGGNIDTADLSATYDGQAMTLLAAETGGGLHKVTAIFYLMNPPTTTGATVAVDYNSKTGRANTTVIEELSGVHASTPWGTPVSADFGGAAMQIGITPAGTTGLIRCVAGAPGANTSMTPTGDTTALYNNGTSPGGDNFNHHWALVGAHDPADTSALTMGATDGESDASIIAAEALAA